MKNLLIVNFLLLISTNLFAAAVPNTYTAGDTLTATSLNENFDSIESDITNLEAYDSSQDTDITNLQTDVSTLQSDVSALQTNDTAQDTAISNLQSAVGSSYGMIRLMQQDGSLLGYVTGAPLNPIGNDAFQVITSKKYILVLNPGLNDGGFYPHNINGKEFLYESNDCTGQAYTTRREPAVHASFGFLVKNYNSNDFFDSEAWYYIPPGTSDVTINKQSTKLNGICTAESAIESYRRAVYPNDSNVTGFSGLNNPITFKLPFEN